MTSLLTEIQAMQNPALGAGLIWRFVCGYSPKDQSTRGTPLPLSFLVLPAVLHARTRDEMNTTRAGSGIRKFEQKFEDSSDLLLAIQPRAVSMRSLSLRSLNISLATGLTTLLPGEAILWPKTYVMPKGFSKSTEGLMAAAEKLGAWCAPLSLRD